VENILELFYKEWLSTESTYSNKDVHHIYIRTSNGDKMDCFRTGSSWVCKLRLADGTELASTNFAELRDAVRMVLEAAYGPR